MDSETVVEIRLEQLRAEASAVGQRVFGLVELAWEGFRKQDLTLLLPAERLGREIHLQATRLTADAVKQSIEESDRSAEDQELFYVPMHLERIGDHVQCLVGAIVTKVREGIPFSERASREIDALFEKVVELLECVRERIRTDNRVAMKDVLAKGHRYEERANEYALAHERRLLQGVCMPRAASMYLAIVDSLRGVAWQTCEIARKLVPGYSPGQSSLNPSAMKSVSE